jgi:hypothetical protein
VNFVARSPGGNLAGGSYLHPEGASIVDPALPAGRYRLEMALDGYRTRGVEAEVRPGEITDVDVALERE